MQFIPRPNHETAHAGLPIGAGMKVPTVHFAAIALTGKLDAGVDVEPAELEENAEALEAGARYADALLTIATNGTRDQMIRHLTWMRDNLRCDASYRRAELRQQSALTA